MIQLIMWKTITVEHILSSLAVVAHSVILWLVSVIIATTTTTTTAVLISLPNCYTIAIALVIVVVVIATTALL